MKALEKYVIIRDEICNGDIILTRGTSWLSKTIRFFDKSYYNHAGVVMKANDRLFIVDSNAGGVKPEFLSVRLKDNEDFCIIRPSFWAQKEIDRALNQWLDTVETGIKYDTMLLLQIAIYRSTGIKTHFGKDNKDICSEAARREVRCLAPKEKCYEFPFIKTDFITPWDFIVYADDKFKVLFNDCDMSKFRKK